MRFRSKIGVTATALILAGSLVATTNAVASASSAPKTTYKLFKVPKAPSSLVKKAEAEGALTVYLGVSTTAIVNGIQQAWEAAYPQIKLTIFAEVEQSLELRFQTEEQTGVYNADVVTAAYDPSFNTELHRGYLERMEKIIPGFYHYWPAKYSFLDNAAFGIALVPYGFVYNSNLVTGSNVPTTWADFAKPFWKGRLANQIPSGTPAHYQLFDLVNQRYGAKTLAAIGQNLAGPLGKLTSAPSEAAAVASGQAYGGIVTTASSNEVLIQSGAPLKFVVPPFTSGNEYTSMVVTHAPHPAAAALWMYWIYSHQGQLGVQSAFSANVPSIAKGLPSQFKLDLAHSTKPSVVSELNSLLGY